MAENAATPQIDNKLSHKKRKALWKKEKRKSRRQALAKQRDEELERELEKQKQSPGYAARLDKEELEERAELLRQEAESRHQHELWLWSEEVFAEKLRKKKEQEEREEQIRLETERKIKEEWEERQKKEKEEEEEKRKKKEKQEELLRKAREGENKNGEWHNPLAPVQYGQERQLEMCPFFAKVGACRFGDRCSRGHPIPESSGTLMFPGMFRHFQLDQGLCEEYDTDIVLEYEDSEVYQKFGEFYDDVLPELREIGHVTQFKVCCNYQPHLRGNVYITYEREIDALKAIAKFNARWYGGRQLSAQFVQIPSWRRAICGLFGKGKCPKGKECNFLHVFKNPRNEFSLADRDIENFTSHRDRYSHRQRSRSPDRKWKHSRSPSRSSRHKRSRSRERHRNHQSRRHSRSRSHYSRSRSRSTERYRTPQRSRRRSRSRSPRRLSRSRSRESEKRKKDKTRSESGLNSRNREDCADSDKSCGSEGVWVEKRIDDRQFSSRSRSRSNSRERSKSKKHKKKKKHK